MNLPIPNGYKLYGGADISAYPDADGYIFYSCSARYPDGNTFGQIVVRTKNNVAEVMPLPEFVTGRGQLAWNPAGLFLVTWDDGQPAKYFQINQFKQFTNGFPVVVTNVNTAVSSVDQEARNLAQSALGVANSAKSLANDAKTLATNALNVANTKLNADQVWAKVNDRLFQLKNAIANNDYADQFLTDFVTVLYGQVRNWAYAQLKEYGLIK